MSHKEPSVMLVSEARWGGQQTLEMFTKNGFRAFAPVLRKDEPDLIVFLGGEDVNPKLYGEEILRGTHINERRDRAEAEVFKNFPLVPKVGICRGGQFLNVMSGGAMWQNVDNHTRNHTLVDLWHEDYHTVTSTHHQMMIPGEDGEVLAIAHEAKLFQSATERQRPKEDTEVVFYRKTNSLCFQPHPEYSPGETRNLFFRYMKRLWNYGPDPVEPKIEKLPIEGDGGAAVGDAKC